MGKKVVLLSMYLDLLVYMHMFVCMDKVTSVTNVKNYVCFYLFFFFFFLCISEKADIKFISI